MYYTIVLPFHCNIEPNFHSYIYVKFFHKENFVENLFSWFTGDTTKKGIKKQGN